MSFTAEQKSQLAKLMATENLTVQHQKIHTAKFDPVNRILYLPIWQDMSGNLYDLLTGHEVGHALYTPADGWHSAASDKTKPPSYKNFLNVVEDARIEKKVKRRYPGLKTPFQKAYKELFDKDFFGIGSKKISDMAFIDRLNIYTKSQYTANWIKFSAEESVFVDKIQLLETWEDVVKLTDEIFAYSKDEQFELKPNDIEIGEDEYGQDPYGDDFDSGSDFDDSENEDGPEQKSKNSKSGKDDEGESDESTTGADGEPDSDKLSESDEDGSKISRHKETNVADKNMFNPKCVTDEQYRKNESALLDEESKPYLYLNIPKFNVKLGVTPAKKVIEQIDAYYFKAGQVLHDQALMSAEDGRKLVSDFKTRNERYIGLLVKEFEMRKAAKAFSKSRLSETGDIDINKLSSYKFDDNIFRKVMLTPKGKNHGLILLLDKSGSMGQNMPGSIEQILILATFCRKVNIPFAVYGFSNSDRSFKLDHNLKDYSGVHMGQVWSTGENELGLSPMQLREYLNSSMSNVEFSLATKALLALKRSHEIRFMGQPRSEELTNTPLIEAIIASGYLMKQFRQKYGLDLSSLIIVHDGDSDMVNRYHYTYEVYNDREKKYEKISRTSHFSLLSSNICIQDTTLKFSRKLEKRKNYDEMLIVALEWFRQVSQSKVFGFFLAPDNRGAAKNALYNRYVFEDGEHFDTKRFSFHRQSNQSGLDDMDIQLDKIVKKFKQEKFVACKPFGYDEFYIVAGGTDLVTDNEELEIEGKATPSKLKSAFLKLNKKKAINRVLVSRFIQGIAA